jgi:uncharacterized membrane protein YphA (DoxX/SURF4 family)
VTLLTALVAFSSVAFLVYGVLCLATDSMKGEFLRFGLEHLRILTGILEVMGGVGLLVGLWWRPAILMASAGLSLLMLLGVGVRIWVKDGVLETLPAFVLMLVNLYIFVTYLKMA